MDLWVVVGKHEVLCEFAGQPKLAELHTAVHKALCELNPETSLKFEMKLMPEGLLLSDDSNVAALSSGSTIEVIPDERELAICTLKDAGVRLDNGTPDLMRAVERGDTETVRLILLAWGPVDGFALYTLRSALRAALAAANGRDWVFASFKLDADVLHNTLMEAFKENRMSIVRTIASRNTLQQDWLSKALLSQVNAAFSDRTDICHLLVELGAKVPRNASLHRATCLGFFAVLIAHGADVERRHHSRDSTPLHTTACPHKQQALVKLGADVNTHDSEGFHILMRQPAHLGLMALAIEHGADVNAVQGSTGMTCLMHVCAQGECPPVALLLDHGADLEATDAEGATALWYAGSEDVLRLLMQRDAAINVRDGKGEQFLHYLFRECFHNDGAELSLLRALVAQPHLDVNVADTTGRTVLMRAARGTASRSHRLDGQHGADYSWVSVAFLLEHADIDVGVQDSDGMTCLMHAASAKNVVACEEILAYFKANNRTADVSVQDSNGWTCLTHAVSATNCNVFYISERADTVRAQLVALLTAHGADPSVHVVYGLSALHITAANNNDAVFAALLAAGACPNTCDGRGVPLLHTLVVKSVVQLEAQLEALLASPGLDIDVRDSNGRTALMRGARLRATAGCVALLEKGADVGAQDNNGFTCLGYAVASGDVGVATLLLDHGAGIDDGIVPPLLTAVLQTPMCRVLLEHGADVTKPSASLAARLRRRGAKTAQALVHDTHGGSGGDGAELEAVSAPGAVGETPASSKRKRDDDTDHPAASTHSCAVCGAVALSSGEPFPSAESVLRHASSKHRMRHSEYTRRFGE